MIFHMIFHMFFHILELAEENCSGNNHKIIPADSQQLNRAFLKWNNTLQTHAWKIDVYHHINYIYAYIYMKHRKTWDHPYEFLPSLVSHLADDHPVAVAPTGWWCNVPLLKNMSSSMGLG